MKLIDEGELSSGLHQETLEDTEAAIHPHSHLHMPQLLLHTVGIFFHALCSFMKYIGSTTRQHPGFQIFNLICQTN